MTACAAPARCPRCKTGNLIRSLDGAECLQCGHQVVSASAGELEDFGLTVEMIGGTRSVRLPFDDDPSTEDPGE